MASLRTTPGSSTVAQRKRLLYLGRKRGLNVDDLRSMVGGSLRAASSAVISDAIARLGGGDLPNPPGQKPRAYSGKPAPGATRIAVNAHVEQIWRLMLWYWDDDEERCRHWLQVNFGVRDPEDIETAKKATEIIWVLKGMHKRRETEVRA